MSVLSILRGKKFQNLEKIITPEFQEKTLAAFSVVLKFFSNSSTENKCQLRKWYFLKVFSSYFSFFSIGRAFVFIFWEIFLMYIVANTFFSVLWVFMGLFGKFFEIFIGFCFLYVEAIIYGGIFRSNCENFESKDDRNREERILFFLLLFGCFFFTNALSFV